MPDPIVVQASITIPLALGFAAYSVTRRDRTRLHTLAAGLVGLLALWITSLTLRRIGDAEAVGLLCFQLEHVSTLLMSPLFLVMMGYFARHPAFEQGRAVNLGIGAV